MPLAQSFKRKRINRERRLAHDNKCKAAKQNGFASLTRPLLGMS